MYGDSPWRFWTTIKTKFAKNRVFSDWVTFADFVLRHLAIPTSSACCERLFYRQNQHMPAQRASMSEKTAIARITLGRK